MKYILTISNPNLDIERINEISNERYELLLHQVMKGDAGTTDHTQLTNKDAANQHPISAITGLQSALDGKCAVTPSGDPMHYLYVTAGAEYNDTGADIAKTLTHSNGSVISYIHKAGMWAINCVGDLTTQQMREVYVKSTAACQTSLAGLFARDTTVRTMILHGAGNDNLPTSLEAMCQSTRNLECVRVCYEYTYGVMAVTPTGSNNALINAFRDCSVLKYIIAPICVDRLRSISDYAFRDCPLLQEVAVRKLKCNIAFYGCPNLSKESILYMINNEAATSAITITLHATAYAMASADTDIQTALSSHTNVTLASA